MYAIVGASGNTGKIVAEKLLAHGEKVRVIGRDSGRLEGLVLKGAEGFVANVTDAAALTRAFSGAKAAYLMIPPNPTAPDVRGDQERVSDALVAAVRNAGVHHAVVLSSVGADKADKTGPVVGLYSLEQKLNAVGGLNAVYDCHAGYWSRGGTGIVEAGFQWQTDARTPGTARCDLPGIGIRHRPGHWQTRPQLCSVSPGAA